VTIHLACWKIAITQIGDRYRSFEVPLMLTISRVSRIVPRPYFEKFTRASCEFNFHLRSSSAAQTRRDYSLINLLFSSRPSSSVLLLPPIVAVAAEMSRLLRLIRSTSLCRTLQLHTLQLQ